EVLPPGAAERVVLGSLLAAQEHLAPERIDRAGRPEVRAVLGVRAIHDDAAEAREVEARLLDLAVASIAHRPNEPRAGDRRKMAALHRVSIRAAVVLERVRDL